MSYFKVKIIIKEIAIILISCIPVATVFSQSEELFRDTIYFIDAVGNKDTLILRYYNKLNDIYNPTLGEIIDNSPFDSVFEVRAGLFDYRIPFDSINFSKNPIFIFNNGTSTDCYGIYERANLFIYSKYQPVTIKWDRHKWNNQCLGGSWITVDYHSETAFYWWTLDVEYDCMNSVDSVQYNLPYFGNKNWSSHLEALLWSKIVPIEGGGVDTVFNVQIAPAPIYNQNTPCTIVSSNDALEEKHFPITIYPNPANDRLTIEAEGQKPEELIVYNSVGVKLIQTKYLPILEISQLLPGMYYLQCVWEDNKRSEGATTFVKW